MKAKVFYWTDSKWLNTDKDNIPDLWEVVCTYKLVTEFEIPDGHAFLSARDFVFQELNINPRKYIKYPLPDKVHHTSMNVGDILCLEGWGPKDHIAYICLPFGWKEIK